ncbi:unnamed protein product [Rotaria magnacalcarata]|uniref:Uncharacterized protein n=2 Tax=Rotaria magnacalcarata TaxID=392030 RepID=A0A814P637_9BILA|nr:unnamed protein product [Rotaria magnacalcarata]CAF3917797.1 unnamed protein product [Rotaria magnacalcarata]
MRSHAQVEPLGIQKPTKKSRYWNITFKECLTLLIGTAIPVAIGIYAAVTNEQTQKSAKRAEDKQQSIAAERRMFELNETAERRIFDLKEAAERRAFDLKQAAEVYQQQLYKNFLDAMYTLHRDGELNDSADPWPFANAHYRGVHREFDAIRKAQALIFLKEKKLIGRENCTTGCEPKLVKDIIRLNGLGFDNLNLSSETGNLSRLDLSCVVFDRISMINSIFSYANLNGVIFRNSRLNGATFRDSSLNCSKIIDTELHGTNFYNSNLNDALFNNVDLSTAVLTQTQIQGAHFENVILPNGTRISSTTTMTSIITEERKTTEATTEATTEIKTTEATTIKITRVMLNISVNATWSKNGTTIAGGNESGGATNQLNVPHGLSVDDDQTVFVADTWNHRIIQWKQGATDGQVVAGGNGQGNRLDQLNVPTDVLIDKETDSLIICDQYNRRVVRWSRRNGTTQGEILITNIGCWGLAMDDQKYLYSTNGDKYEVRQYRIGDGNETLVDGGNGTIVAGGYGNGSGLNQIHGLTYICVDQQQNIYVAEGGNCRVTKWMKDAKEGVVVAGGQGYGSAPTQLGTPRGIFVDALGTLYVVDLNYDRVSRWPQGVKQSTVIAGGNGQGAGENQLYWPTGLSFDQHGNLYVADRKNHRIQRFSLE